jgi:hypothetical protein
MPERGKEAFLYSTASRPALEPTQSPIQWVPGALPPGINRQWSEALYSPPSGEKVKNCGATPSLLIRLHGTVLYSEQNYFLQDGVVSPMPNPHPGGPGCLS